MRLNVDRRLAGASLVIAAGLVLIGFAATRSVSGDDVPLPEGIERITPIPEAINVPNQAPIEVDLADNYVGRIAVDGTVYETQMPTPIDPTADSAGRQIVVPAGVSFQEGTNVLKLSLGEEIGIERWDDGVHLVRVDFWPIDEGEAAAESFHWAFTSV